MNCSSLFSLIFKRTKPIWPLLGFSVIRKNSEQKILRINNEQRTFAKGKLYFQFSKR